MLIGLTVSVKQQWKIFLVKATTKKLDQNVLKLGVTKFRRFRQS